MCLAWRASGGKGDTGERTTESDGRYAIGGEVRVESAGEGGNGVEGGLVGEVMERPSQTTAVTFSRQASGFPEARHRTEWTVRQLDDVTDVDGRDGLCVR